MGADVWRSDLADDERGVKILGTPLGSPEFVSKHLRERLAEERRLLEQIPKLPDAQCAWLLLHYCAAPRANHLLRTLPPEEVQQYAQDHDNEIWRTLLGILGGPLL